MSKYYPINLVLTNKKCLVVGAGTVAERKARRLLECGAYVTVISPESTAGIKSLSRNKKIIFKKRKVNLSDLKGVELVISATSDRDTNQSISTYCGRKGILVNVVDSPKECTFILPSMVRRGALTISISTEGVSPALAKKIRQDLEKSFGCEYAKLLGIMKKMRPQVMKDLKTVKAKRQFYQFALRPDILSLIRGNKTRQAKARIEAYLKNVV